LQSSEFSLFLSAWASERQTRNLAHKLHAPLTFWPFCFVRSADNDSRPPIVVVVVVVVVVVYSKVELRLRQCFVVAPGLTLGSTFWPTVVCFVSRLGGGGVSVIYGRGPGHLRSTAVDSSEIESSSRSVTMSSLRSWLGRRPTRPQHSVCVCVFGGGGLHEFQTGGHKMWVHRNIVLVWRERDLTWNIAPIMTIITGTINAPREVCWMQKDFIIIVSVFHEHLNKGITPNFYWETFIEMGNNKLVSPHQGFLSICLCVHFIYVCVVSSTSCVCVCVCVKQVTCEKAS